MKTSFLLFASLLLASVLANATPTLIVGTPADSYLSSPTGPSPIIGGKLLNFDSLTPYTTFTSYSAKGITISSSDGLEVYPFSTQSAPNYLYDTSSDGSANILISLEGVKGVAFGIADADPVSITLQALDKNGNALGSAFTVDPGSITGLPNPFNGYYAILDSSADIYGVEIQQPMGDPSFSGLAIDDVQATPEPASLSLFVAGLLGLGGFRLRKRG